MRKIEIRGNGFDIDYRCSGDGSFMHPLVEHVCDWLASPLWSHVANTFDCDKVKAIVAFNITADLSISHPWAPFIENIPVESLNPLFGAICWDCTIGVTRVEHHSVFVLKN